MALTRLGAENKAVSFSSLSEWSFQSNGVCQAIRFLALRICRAYSRSECPDCQRPPIVFRTKGGRDWHRKEPVRSKQSCLL